MRHLPLFVDLSRRTCVVVGGGTVAERKLDLLMRAASDLLVVSPVLTPRLMKLHEAGAFRWRARRFESSDLEGAHLVIAATGDGAVNEAVSRAAHRQDLLCNVVDQPALSNFISPAIVDRSPLLVAIGSEGTMPVLARRVRAWLERLLPQGIGALAAAAGRWRRPVARRFPDLDRRRAFWEGVLDEGLAVPDSGDAIIRRRLENPERPSGRVVLVGAGPGDPDLLTLKALQVLQQADVILHDRLVSDAVLERARRDAQRIDVGKKAGDHRFSQAQINRLMIRHARAGRLVCRLKGGDPGLFGRAGEELRALRRKGIQVDIVPGITAAQGCAAAAGISLTDRQSAHSLLLATAHRADDRSGRLAVPASGQTSAWYMPVRQLGTLAAQLMAQGMDPAVPAALVENGTRPGQRVIRSNLRYIEDRARQAGIGSPALLIVGEVVAELDSDVVSGVRPAHGADTGASLNAA